MVIFSQNVERAEKLRAFHNSIKKKKALSARLVSLPHLLNRRLPRNNFLLYDLPSLDLITNLDAGFSELSVFSAKIF